MGFDADGVFAKIEDMYDNKTIFIGVALLVLIIIILVILMLYFGVRFSLAEFVKS